MTRRACLVGPAYPYRGGIAHFTSLLAAEFAKDHDVLVVNFKRLYPSFLFPGKSQMDESKEPLSVPSVRTIDSMDPSSFWRTARTIARFGPDIVVFQWWHPFFAAAYASIVFLLRRMRGGKAAKIVYLCHNVMPHEGSRVQTLLTRYAFPSRGFYIVHSEQDRQQLVSLRPDATIRKGCHPTYSEFAAGHVSDKREARRSLGLAEDRKTLLFFGLVRAYKGLKYLIEAMVRVRGTLDCHLLVVGEFYDDKAPYLELIKKLGLSEAITVVDRYVPNEEVARYFSAADVAVLPYTSATQSGIVQVAFGLNTPVIVTRVGGLPEVVDDGGTGFVVEPESAEALAAAIIRYYEGGFETRFRAEIARQADRFGWDEEIAQFEEFMALARDAAVAPS